MQGLVPIMRFPVLVCVGYFYHGMFKYTLLSLCQTLVCRLNIVDKPSLPLSLSLDH